jgi:hypothetical protein
MIVLSTCGTSYHMRLRTTAQAWQLLTTYKKVTRNN